MGDMLKTYCNASVHLGLRLGLGFRLGLLQSSSVELGLLLAGLETAMAELGGGVDELQGDLLQGLKLTKTT